MVVDARDCAEGLGCTPLGELVSSPSERGAPLVIGYRSRGCPDFWDSNHPFPNPVIFGPSDLPHGDRSDIRHYPHGRTCLLSPLFSSFFFVI